MLAILNLLVFVAMFVCFIMVVVQMFKHGEQTVGIICLVTCWCIGPLIGLIYGWINVNKWQVNNLMYIYTALFVASAILSGIVSASGGFNPPEVN